MSIGIVVVYHSRPVELQTCLTHISAESATGSTPTRLVVVDTSGGGLGRVHAMAIRGAIYVHAPENLGYGWAVNIGLDALGVCDAFIVMNSDAYLQPGAVSELSQVSRKTGGLCAPVQLLSVRPALDSVDTILNMPSVSDSLQRWLWVGRRRSIAKRRRYLESVRREAGGWHAIRESFVLSGAVLAFGPGLLTDAGPLPVSTFLQEEDRIYARRVRRSGRRLYLCSGALVHHPGALGAGTAGPRMLAVQTRSELIAWREYRLGPLLLLRAMISLGLAVRFASWAIDWCTGRSNRAGTLTDWRAAFTAPFRDV